jgi:hypothetical protein
MTAMNGVCGMGTSCILHTWVLAFENFLFRWGDGSMGMGMAYGHMAIFFHILKHLLLTVPFPCVLAPLFRRLYKPPPPIFPPILITSSSPSPKWILPCDMAVPAPSSPKNEQVYLWLSISLKSLRLPLDGRLAFCISERNAGRHYHAYLPLVPLLQNPNATTIMHRLR